MGLTVGELVGLLIGLTVRDTAGLTVGLMLTMGAVETDRGTGRGAHARNRSFKTPHAFSPRNLELRTQ